MSVSEETVRVRIVEWGVGRCEGAGCCGERYFEFVARYCEPGGEYEEELKDPVDFCIRLWMHETVRDKLVYVLRLLGYEDESLDRLDPDHPHYFDFYGKELRITIQCDEGGESGWMILPTEETPPHITRQALSALITPRPEGGSAGPMGTQASQQSEGNR